MRRTVLWALALSWLPLWIIAIVAAFRDHDQLALFIGAMTCCWIMALGDMFDLFDRVRKPL